MGKRVRKYLVRDNRGYVLCHKLPRLYSKGPFLDTQQNRTYTKYYITTIGDEVPANVRPIRLLSSDCFVAFCPSEFQKYTGIGLTKLEYMEVHFTETGIKYGSVWEVSLK